MNEAIQGFKDEYSWLSNFFPSTVWWEGVPFPTVEHAYQAAKTEDVDDHLRIADLSSPGLAKKEGNRVNLREDWEEIKDDVMYDLCHQKFQNKKLKEMLLNTANRKLEEHNNWKDSYWGIYKGVGENKLGKILMRIRKEAKNM